MQRNTMKQKLLAGDAAFGVASSIRSATAAGVLARAGSDYVLIDCQHGEWDDAGSADAIRAIYLQNVTPVTRVRSNDFGLIGRALDSGALGVVVPMVNTVAEASAAAYAMRGSAAWVAVRLATTFPSTWGLATPPGPTTKSSRPSRLRRRGIRQCGCHHGGGRR